MWRRTAERWGLGGNASGEKLEEERMGVGRTKQRLSSEVREHFF